MSTNRGTPRLRASARAREKSSAMNGSGPGLAEVEVETARPRNRGKERSFMRALSSGGSSVAAAKKNLWQPNVLKV